MGFEEIMLRCFGIVDVGSVRNVSIENIDLISDNNAGEKYLYNTIYELNKGCYLSDKSKKELISLIHRATCWMLGSIITKNAHTLSKVKTSMSPMFFESILQNNNIDRSFVGGITNSSLDWFELVVIEYYKPVWDKIKIANIELKKRSRT